MQDVSRNAVRVDASGEVRTRLEPVVCDECQALCYAVEVWALDLAGSGERACLLFRPHVPTRGKALRLLAQWIAGVATGVQHLEDARWDLEHQPTLFD